MHLQPLRDYYESVLSVLTPLVWLGLKHQVTYFSFGAPCAGSAPWQLLAGCLSQIHHCHCLKGSDNLAKLGSKKGPNTYLWSQMNKEDHLLKVDQQVGQHLHKVQVRYLPLTRTEQRESISTPTPNWTKQYCLEGQHLYTAQVRYPHLPPNEQGRFVQVGHQVGHHLYTVPTPVYSTGQLPTSAPNWTKGYFSSRWTNRTPPVHSTGQIPTSAPN